MPVWAQPRVLPNKYKAQKYYQIEIFLISFIVRQV